MSANEDIFSCNIEISISLYPLVKCILLPLRKPSFFVVALFVLNFVGEFSSCKKALFLRFSSLLFFTVEKIFLCPGISASSECSGGGSSCCCSVFTSKDGCLFTTKDFFWFFSFPQITSSSNH